MGLGAGGEVRLVGQPRDEAAERAGGGEHGEDVDVAPAEVGGDAQGAGDAVDEAGQRERGAGEVHPVGGQPLEQGGGELPEAVEGVGGCAAAQVDVLDVLAEHAAGEVHGTHAEVVDVDLEADARDAPRDGRQGHGGPPGAREGDGVELADEAGLDEQVGQAGDGAAGEAGGGGDLGARRRGDGVDDVPEDDREVVGAQVLLAARAHRPGQRVRCGGGVGHGVDPTDLTA